MRPKRLRVQKRVQPKPKSFWRGWSDLIDFLRNYWTAYGGIKKLLGSPYLQISLLITVCSYGLWMRPEWWETFLTINPAILGFTIGGFALLLATGADKFGAILAEARLYEKSELESPLAKLGAAFVHFIIIQFASIIYSIIAKAADKVLPQHHFEFLACENVRRVFWGIGFFVGIYALVCAIATAEWIFRIVVLLVKFQKARFKIEKRNNEAVEDKEAPGSEKPPHLR